MTTVPAHACLLEIKIALEASEIAKAAGIMEHLWTIQELLLYRLPASFPDRLYGFDHFVSTNQEHPLR